MKKFKFEFKVSDKFEKERCWLCPLSYNNEINEHFCNLLYKYNECPLLEVKKLIKDK